MLVRSAVLAFAAFAAFVGSYFSLTLYGTVSFVFGSIVALVALKLLGFRMAIAIAFAGSVYTYVAWGHPYAMLIFICEVIFVGLLARKSDNLALIDALYWACIGLPLVLLTYAGVMGNPLGTAVFIGLKQSVNGVLNAVIAGLLLGFLPMLSPRLCRLLPQVSFRALLFHILAFIAISTSLALTVAESRSEYRRQIDQIAVLLNAVAQHSHTTQFTSDVLDPSFTELILPILGTSTGVRVSIDDLAIAVVSKDGVQRNLLGDVRSHDTAGTTTRLVDGLWRWSPSGTMPELTRSTESVYLARLAKPAASGGDELLVELSARPVIQALEISGRRNLLLLAAAMAFVLLTSKIFIRQLTAPLMRLATATHGLPRLIASNGEIPNLPASTIHEYDRLTSSFQEMARELKRLFREQDKFTQTLEARVEERTQQIALLSQIARQTTNGVVVTDLDGRVTWVNDAFEELTGYGLEEMRGKVPGHVLQRTRPPPEVTHEMREGIRLRQTFHVELLNHAKDGRPYWVGVRCNPLVDAQGEPIGFIAIENDVTERLDIQHALQESLERLQLATDVAEMGVWAVDPETGRIEWNERNFRLHGIAPDQDIAATWLDRVKPEDGERISEIFRGLMDGRLTTACFEFQFNHPDRGPRFLSSIARATMDKGKVMRILGVTRDITAERQASELLRRSAQHTEAILNNVVDAIITIDVEGRITSSNRAAEAIFGYSTKQMVGRSISMLMTKENADVCEAFIAASIEGTPARRIGEIGRFTAVRANGEVFPIELCVSEVDEGNGRFFLGIIRDITERERVERMQSEFLATVNHELRTPLTTIRGTLSLLNSKVLGSLDDHGERIVAAALKNAETLGQMVEEMLDLERMRQGKLEIRPAPEPVEPLVQQSVELNRMLAEAHDNPLILEPGGDAAVMVTVDAKRFTQILTNFISNAVKFSEAGKPITIRTTVRDGKARVSVIDEGPGIPKDKQGLLFQKFSQVDTSDARRHRGAGLGLAISRELATRMGGTVGLISEEGSGSEFWVEFPCEKHPPATVPSSDEAPPMAEVDHA